MKTLHLITVGMGALLLAGCGKPSADAPNANPSNQAQATSATASTSESSQPSLNGDGVLVLPEDTRKSMSITTSPVQQKAFAGMRVLSFQIFRESDEKPLPGLIYRPGFAYGMALMGSDQPRFKVGQEAFLQTTTVDSNSSPARVVEIDSLPGSAAHQNEVVVEIPDKEHQLELSQSCAMSFPTEEVREAIVVPHSAILQATSGVFVYAQVPEGFKRTPVVVSTATPEESQISEGLKPGDVVVTNPVQVLWLTELKLKSGTAP